MLDVRRLRVLSEIARRGSFSAAADALSLTQSAVSQHIAALEREVGMTLVERGMRPVELTEAGHALTRHAAAAGAGCGSGASRPRWSRSSRRPSRASGAATPT
jgi:molybdate transport repressor ModE-like protein